jgi:hypothetical protein
MGSGEMTSISIVDYARRETEYHVKNSVDPYTIHNLV